MLHFVLLLVSSLTVLIGVSANIRVITDSSIDELKREAWLLLVHSSSCSQCNLLQHAWVLLSHDPELSHIHLATLEVDSNRLGCRRLNAIGAVPQILLIRNGDVIRSEESFGSVEDMKQFAISPGKEYSSYQILNANSSPKDYSPSTEGLTGVIIMCVGMAFLAYTVKGSVFESRSLGEIAERRKRLDDSYSDDDSEGPQLITKRIRFRR